MVDDVSPFDSRSDFAVFGDADGNFDTSRFDGFGSSPIDSANSERPSDLRMGKNSHEDIAIGGNHAEHKAHESQACTDDNCNRQRL